MSYTNTSGGSDNYNAGAAHDSGFYDPDRHDNQIVAVFEDEAAARVARDALVDAGVPEDQVQVIGHVEGDAAKGVSQSEDKAVGDQILTAFIGLFSSHHDEQDYTHAVAKGHAMVVVTPVGDTDRHRVIQVLEHSHPIDFDAKLEEWRQAGYDNSGAPRSPQHDDTRRVGQRETPAQDGSSRVRSYVADRETGMGTGGVVTNATPGATSSGMNSPRD
jgi:hypothetical protein